MGIKDVSFGSKYGADALKDKVADKKPAVPSPKRDEFKASENKEIAGNVAGVAAATVATVAAVKNRSKIAEAFKKIDFKKITEPIGKFFKKIPEFFKKENIKKVTEPIGKFFKKIPEFFKKDNIKKITEPIGKFFKKLPNLFKKAV